MYIVSYVQLTVLQQSIATADRLSPLSTVTGETVCMIQQ